MSSALHGFNGSENILQACHIMTEAECAQLLALHEQLQTLQALVQEAKAKQKTIQRTQYVRARYHADPQFTKRRNTDSTKRIMHTFWWRARMREQ